MEEDIDYLKWLLAGLDSIQDAKEIRQIRQRIKKLEESVKQPL